jgi:hypothetical protein
MTFEFTLIQYVVQRGKTGAWNRYYQFFYLPKEKRKNCPQKRALLLPWHFTTVFSWLATGVSQIFDGKLQMLHEGVELQAIHGLHFTLS